MGMWLVLIGLSALAGGICAWLLPRSLGWVAAALLPPLGLFAWLMINEYLLPYRGGGASMWPIALIVGGFVAALVGLGAYAAFRPKTEDVHAS